MTLDVGPPELPAGAMLHAAVTVVGYFGDDGLLMYAVRAQGDVPLSTTLGLLELAKHDLYARAQSDE